MRIQNSPQVGNGMLSPCHLGKQALRGFRPSSRAHSTGLAGTRSPASEPTDFSLPRCSAQSESRSAGPLQTQAQALACPLWWEPCSPPLRTGGVCVAEETPAASSRALTLTPVNSQLHRQEHHQEPGCADRGSFPFSFSQDPVTRREGTRMRVGDSSE